MKAVCFSQQWIRQINSSEDGATEMTGTSDANQSKQTSSQYDCRILVIQAGRDNPQHFNALTNAVFACQKLRICLDCLVMDRVQPPVINVDGAAANSSEPAA